MTRALLIFALLSSALGQMTIKGGVTVNGISISSGNTGFGPPSFNGSTTSTLQQNKVAGCNANVKTGYCGRLSAANAPATAYSISSGVLCVTVPNVGSDLLSTVAFASGEIVGLSGATTAPVNGLILTTNGSTSSTQVCGTLANTHGATVTPVTASGSETTIYLQGQGWQPFMVAPFPAPGNVLCANGNGTTITTSGSASTCSAPITTGAALSGINTWSFDWAIPGAALNTPPRDCGTQLIDTSFDSGRDYNVSLTGETNDANISLDDTAGGYFFTLVFGGGVHIGHMHINPTLCNGLPGLIMDSLTIGNTLQIDAPFYGAFSRHTRPGLNQALRFFVDQSSVFAPKLDSVVLNYSGGVVTAGTPTVLFNINTCPGFNLQNASQGGGIQPRMDNSDTNMVIGWGAGNQGSFGRHTEYIINTSTNKCTTVDTAGFSGTGVTVVPSNVNLPFNGAWAGVSPMASSPFGGNGTGTGYIVGDTVSIPCGATAQITAVNSGSGAPLHFTVLTAGSGCTLGDIALSGGSGTGGKTAVLSIGQPTNYTIYYNGGTATVPTFTYSPNCAVTPCALEPIGIHSGTMDQSGTYAYTSGWDQSGQGSGPGQAPNGTSAAIYINVATGIPFAQTNVIGTGHPAIGYGAEGKVSSPGIYVTQLPDINCLNAGNCPQIFNFSSVGNGQFHDYWPSPLSDQSYPLGANHSLNAPGDQPGNPPGWTGPYGMSALAIHNPGSSVGPYPVSWFFHFYSNTNNSNQNGDAQGTITSYSQDFKVLLTVIDGNCNFAGNTSFGQNASSACFSAIVGVVLN